MIRGVDWSPNGKKIICADEKAKIRLLDTASLRELGAYSGIPAKKNKNSKGFV
jgi:WD40 repeat protein